MKIKSFFVIAIATLTSQMLHASDIDELIGIIRQNNIDIKAVDARFNTSSLSIKSTNNLLDATSVDFEYEFGEKSVGDKYSIGISQGFNWPGLYNARSKADKAHISALSYVAIAQKCDILLNIKQICNELVFTNRQIALQSEMVNNMNRLKTAYDKGFERGEVSIIDVNKLKIEILDISRNLNILRSRRSVLTESLRTANGGIRLSDELVNGLTEYSSQELQPITYYSDLLDRYDPDLNNARIGLEASKYDVSVAKMQNFPGFSVGYKYTNELGDQFHGITAGITIPYFANSNNVGVSKAQQIAMQYEKEGLDISKQSELYADYTLASSLCSQIKDYGDALGKENIEVLNKALDGSQITLLDYITEVNFFIEATKNLLSMEYEYNSLITKIDRYSLIISE